VGGALFFGESNAIGERMAKSTLKTIGLLIGIALLAVGVRQYANAVISERSVNFEPLVLPVSLIPGTIRAPEMSRDLSGEYEIVIALKRHSMTDLKMNCSLGLDTVRNQCTGIPNLIDISWELFNGENMVYAGNSQETPWEASWSDTTERMIGRFKAEKGLQYTLVLQVKRDASQLNIENPKIVVHAPYGHQEDYTIGTFVQKAEAGILAIIGTAILAVLLVIQLRSRKRKATN
jgi:hypothetical protein